MKFEMHIVNAIIRNSCGMAIRTFIEGFIFETYNSNDIITRGSKYAFTNFFLIKVLSYFFRQSLQ